MLKKPSEVKRFKTNNKQCSFVLTASCGLYVHSIAEQNIQLHIYHDLNQCNVFALCWELMRPACPYLAFPLNAVWCLLTTAERDVSLDDEMVPCVTMPLQIWLAIRALWLVNVNTSMALLLLSNDTIVCTELTQAWGFIRCHSLFSEEMYFH